MMVLYALIERPTFFATGKAFGFWTMWLLQ
jgi:hypothetical protein